MSKSYVNRIKSNIDKFKQDYHERIYSIGEEVKDAIAETLENGFGKQYDEYEKVLGDFTELLDKLKILSYSALGAKKEVNDYIFQLRRDLCKSPQHKSIFKIGISDPMNKVTDLFDEYRGKVYQNLQGCLNKVNTSPFGKGTKIQSHIKFQSNCLEFLAWSFIDELQIYGKNELKEIGLKIDGAFSKQNLFDAQDRVGYQFNNLLVECKNHGKLTHKDIMQLFTYALLLVDKRGISPPLGIIVSRKNPDEKDEKNAIWQLKRILKKEWKFEVVFLDIGDLSKMAKIFKREGDPAYVIKQKVQESEKIWRGE